MNGQRVMAVCRTVPVMSSSFSAMRFVVSLETVDRAILFLIGAITLLALLILLVVFLMGLSFTGSIVRPIREIGAAARRIAGGDFGTRISRLADDELGELCATVNSMADELETNERLKNDFISSVSHELRTPLTAIKGWAETLMDAGADGAITPEELQLLQKGMRVITDETQRLSGMVEELLDFSRMQSGRLRMDMQKMDILAELEEAVLIYEEKARQEGITLRYSEPPMLPVTIGDKARLRQVFINVIDNAIKYSDSGGEVRVAASVRGDSILIQVSDDGIGIAPEDLPRVKTRFYKGNYSRRGSGIGLAVADEIVSQHGGSLSLTSTLGIGTSVQILLPIRSDADQPPVKGDEGQKIIEIQ
jgi:signal transduction histidine kinase